MNTKDLFGKTSAAIVIAVLLASCGHVEDEFSDARDLHWSQGQNLEQGNISSEHAAKLFARKMDAGVKAVCAKTPTFSTRRYYSFQPIVNHQVRLDGYYVETSDGGIIRIEAKGSIQENASQLPVDALVGGVIVAQPDKIDVEHMLDFDSAH